MPLKEKMKDGTESNVMKKYAHLRVSNKNPRNKLCNPVK